ncbi:hypothetical protein O9929_14095 [Vibrio lentus]|nr:hypothetical protein [Vibrio lentus]
MITIKPKFIVNDIHAVAAAAQKRLGLASSLPVMYPRDEFNSSAPEYHRGDRQAYLVYKERKYQPKALTLLIDALIESVRSFHSDDLVK